MSRVSFGQVDVEIVPTCHWLSETVLTHCDIPAIGYGTAEGPATSDHLLAQSLTLPLLPLVLAPHGTRLTPSRSWEVWCSLFHQGALGTTLLIFDKTMFPIHVWEGVSKLQKPLISSTTLGGLSTLHYWH